MGFHIGFAVTGKHAGLARGHPHDYVSRLLS